MSIPYPLLLAGLVATGVAAVFFFPEDGLTKLPKLGFEEGTVLFVGDVMLGRSVERYMEREGWQYPFERLGDFLYAPDVTVGNFEAAVPETHVPTPNFTYSFSVRKEYLGVLKEEGFDALSLANNHALDYGASGYAHTKEECALMQLTCFGHPTAITDVATAVLSAGDTRVGLLGIHTLFTAPDMDAIEAELERLKAESDLQIAYVHWGDEYEPQHNASQEALAHALIDLGIDAVVGHHPHVIQDVEIYEGKPVFYSLGNFIFDQYWSPETQEGLGLRLHIGKETVRYELIPVTSIGTKSQPRLVSSPEAEATVSALMERSTGVGEYVKDGSLAIPR